MTAPTFFTVIADYKSVVVDVASDVDADPQLGPITAKVTFTPVLANGDVILATNASPRPTGYVAAPIVARIDTDGRLKLRVDPDGDIDIFANTAAFPATGLAAKVYFSIANQTYYRWNGSAYVETLPYAEVRLLADTALLELDSPLYYRVTFSEVVFNGASGYIAPFVFEAPSTDTELNLIEVTPVPGTLASGQTKIAPGAVRLEDGEIVFSFAGVDIPDPIPFELDVNIDEIADAGVIGRELVQAETAASARATLNLPKAPSRLFTSFAGKTAVPAFGDEGVAVTVRAVDAAINSGFTIADGLLQAPGITGTAPERAAYWNQPLAKGSRIGATFKFSASANPINGAVALIFWANSIPTPFSVPQSSVHLVITPNFWEYAVFDPSGFVALGSGFHRTALNQDWDPAVAGSGTLYRAEVSVVGTTATIALPDGLIAKVTDARIGSIARNVACHEIFMNGSGPKAAFADIWADDSSGPLGSTSLSEVGRALLERPTPLPLMTANMIAGGSFARPAAYEKLSPGEISTAQASTGTRSWKLTSTGSFQGLALTRDAVGTISYVETQPARTFRWEAKFRKAAGNDGGGNCSFGINTFTESLASLGQPGIRVISMNSSITSSGWTTISGVGTTPANTCFITLQLAMANDIPVGDELFIDDVILEDVTRDVNRSGRPTSHTTVATTATLTINSDLVGRADVTALAEALTVAAPTGTPNGGQELTIAIVDNGTARAITWNSIWQGRVGPLPATTNVGKSLILQAQWSPSAAKWQVIHRIGAGAGILGDSTDTTALEIGGTGQSNYLIVANSATDPTITAAGSSSNVGISLVPKGSSSVKVGANDVLSDIDEPHDLTSGQNTFSRRLIGTVIAPGTGILRLTYFTARKSETIASFRTVLTTLATTVTLSRIGLYSVNGSGDLTLVGSSANTVEMWRDTAGPVTVSLSTPTAITRGQRYAVGLLIVNSGTACTLAANIQVNATEASMAPRQSGFVGSQTDLLSTISAGSLTNTGVQFYVALVP